LAAATAAAVDPALENPPAEEGRQVHLRADRLVADIDKHTAEFSGNVGVIRGPTHITADYLKLFYDRQAGPDAVRRLDASAVRRMEAHGQVKIRHAGIEASAERAAYDAQNEVLVLEGRDATVARGTYAITGHRFVLERAGENVTVTGDGRNRVRAWFATDARLF
jgi:lipopolysaccharide export system protein LptA